MGMTFLALAVICIIMAYVKSESVLAGLALVLFFVAGGWFYYSSGPGGGLLGDMYSVSGFAAILGGGSVSALSLYLQRPKEEDEAELALDELDEELSDEDKAERKEKFRAIRQAKRIRKANKNLPQGERYHEN